MTSFAFLVLFILAIAGYAWNRYAAASLIRRGGRLHSLTGFHALFSLLVVLVPTTIIILLWVALQGPVIDRLTMASIDPAHLSGLKGGGLQLVLAEIKSISRGRIFGTPEPWKLEAAKYYLSANSVSGWLLLVVSSAVATLLLVFARSRVSPSFRARQGVERISSALMVACATVAIFVTIGIIASLMFETMRFFERVPVTEFLFGLNWEPQIPLRADQVAAEGAFGWVPVLIGTLVITLVALVVAVPVGLMSAIYLNEFAPSWFRSAVKPVLEILAGVPTVVYGFFAILVVAPAIRDFGTTIGVDVSPNTALAAGGVMGFMLIPFISSFGRRRAVGRTERNARRCARPGVDARGNGAECSVSGCTARDRRRGASGRQPRDRRDDDRRHGGRPDREADCQSAGQRHDGHGPDRDLADWGHEFRQSQNAGGLRLGHDVVRHNAGHQRVRAANRAQIPRSLRLRIPKMAYATTENQMSTAKFNAGSLLKKRNRRQKYLQVFGVAAIGFALLVLAVLVVSLVTSGYRAFVQTHVTLDVFVDPAEISAERLPRGGFDDVLLASLQTLFPDVEGRQNLRALKSILSNGAQFKLRDQDRC